MARVHQESFQCAERFCEGFRRRVQEVREGLGISMYALEQRSGVSREMIALIECGESCPSLFVIRRLAFGLGVSVEELLAGLDDSGVGGGA